jgi:hypothetical protein
MATFVKYEHFIEALVNEEVDVLGTTDTFRAVIHSDAPVVATDDELADLTQVTGTGYTAGGIDIDNDGTRSGGTVTMVANTDSVWTATAGDWGSARYVSIHDDTSTTDILMNSYDYGSSFTVGNGETFTVDYGASLATFA